MTPTERELRDALHATPVDPQARERARQMLQAARRDARAVAAPRGRVVRRRPALTLAVAAALGLAAVPAALGEPGADAVGWVKDSLGLGPKVSERPALTSVPGGGRLLVSGASGAWVVASDGSRRRLGAYAGADWSPRGLFVVAWRGGQLSAVTPGGRVRWSITRPAPIAVARWAPGDGFRIAYVSGGALRIVNGDGTGDRELVARIGAATPEWQPGARHVLAYATAGGRVRLLAVDSGRAQLTTRTFGAVRRLAWSRGGTRLAVLTERHLLVIAADPNGRIISRRALPAGTRGIDVAFSPRGDDTLGLVRRHPGGASDEVVLLPARGSTAGDVVFSAPSHLGALAWAPDGARLLVPWREGNQWVFLPSKIGATAEVVAGIARQFAPGDDAPAFPHSVRWCC